jgi:hypothetical protein
MEIEEIFSAAEYLKREADVLSQFTKNALKRNPELKIELLSLLLDAAAEFPEKINEISLPVINKWKYCPRNGGNIDGLVYNHKTLCEKLINIDVVKIDFDRGFVIGSEDIFYLGVEMDYNV